MPKKVSNRSDEAHKRTDAELAGLEQRITEIYREARNSLDAAVREYFAKLETRDAKMKQLIGTVLNGREWTEQDYKLWRLNQIARGKRFEALRDKMAKRYTEANETAVAYINDATPGIYSLNRNYSTYTIDKATGGALTVGPDGETLNADFILFDEQTVKRLIVEQPDVMPYYPPKRAVRRGIDLQYGKSQITKQVTSGALQGLGVGKIADALQERMETMSRTSALRAARTGVTAAQNAGRMDSYHAAETMGIRLRKRWLATLDGRTRHEHQILDGQTQDVDAPFVVEGQKIRYPGDPDAAPHLVYNCRCTLVTALPQNLSAGQRRARDPVTGESVVIDYMTYEDWMKSLKAAHGEKTVDNALKKVHNKNAEREQRKQHRKRQVEAEKATINSPDRKGWVKPDFSVKRALHNGNGFEVFPTGDVLKSRVPHIRPETGYFDVAMHGAPNGVAFGTKRLSTTARELAKIIKHDPNYNGQNVRLLSCSTGKAPEDNSYCVAEDLANALGVKVKAPDDVLYIYPNGDWYVGPFRKTELVEFSPNQRGRFK